MSRRRRIAGRQSRPAKAYRPFPIRRVLIECNRRLAGARGPRAFEAMAALIYRSPQVKSGIVYLGDCCAKAHTSDRCCMAQLMKRCGKTAHRAKYDLADAGLIRLHNAGRGLCPCSRCGGDQSKKAGGSILNAHGQIVSAATGYELDPALFAPPAAEQAAQVPAVAAGRQSRPPTSSGRPVTVEAGRARLRDALERMRSRAGP